MQAPQTPRKPLKPLDEALQELLAHAQPQAGTQMVDTFDADGRVLQQAAVSPLQVPPQDNSAMDGYAVRAAECAGGAAVLPVSQRIPAGTSPEAVARLDRAIADALRAPDIMTKVHNGGMRVTYLDPSAFRTQIGAESATFGTIIKKGDIKLP